MLNKSRKRLQFDILLQSFEVVQRDSIDFLFHVKYILQQFYILARFSKRREYLFLKVLFSW